MSGLWFQVGLVAVLVVVNAAFAGTEMALVSLREGQLQRLEKHSATGELLVRLAREPNQFLATIQVGITLAGFLASATAAVSLAEPLEEPLAFLGRGAGPAAIVLVTLALSYLTLVLGELAPKRLAMQMAERWGLIMARPLAAMSKVSRPLVWLLSHSTDVVVRLVGGDPDRRREEVTEEELRDMVAVQPTFTPEQRQIIDGAFEIADRSLVEILVPRSHVFVVDMGWSSTEALERLAASGHSRAPVADGGRLDQVVGVVHLRQLLDAGDRPISSVVMDLPMFPESARVLDTLRELQAQRAQMALVVDEHGGAEGIVTVEDLVEELVGEIYDETDRDLASVVHHVDGSISLPGRFPIHDLPDIDVDLPRGDYATVAGLVLSALGRIPAAGDGVTVGSWQLTVTSMRGRAITGVSLRPVEPFDVEGSQTDGA